MKNMTHELLGMAYRMHTHELKNCRELLKKRVLTGKSKAVRDIENEFDRRGRLGGQA